MKVLIVSTDTGWSKIMDSEDYLRPHFKVKEFLSKGRTDDNQILLADSDLLDIIEEVRVELDKPLHINAFHRTLKHNKELGSKDSSTHVIGCAVDCYVKGLTAVELSIIFAKHATRKNRSYYHYAITNKDLHFDLRRRAGDKPRNTEELQELKKENSALRREIEALTQKIDSIKEVLTNLLNNI